MRTYFPQLVTRILWLVPAVLLAGTAPLAGAPAAAPASGAACGDGLLSGSETCESCRADCEPKACTTDAKARRGFSLRVAPPRGQVPVAVTARVAYRSNALSLPGKDTDKSVQDRIKRHVNSDTVIVRDRDTYLLVIMAAPQGLSSGPLLDIEFDTCQGAAAPTAADLTCELSGCASSGGPLDGCTCTITAL